MPLFSRSTRQVGLGAVAIGAFAIAGTAQADMIYFQPGFTDELRVIDTDTTIETFVGNMDGIADSWGFSFSPAGTLYGFNRGTQSLYTISLADGSTTLIGTTILGDVESLTFNGDGSQLFVSAGSDLYSLDPANADATLIGNLGLALDGLSVTPVDVAVEGLGTLPAGTIFGVDGTDLYTVDATIGSLTTIGTVGGPNETIAFAPDGTLYGHNNAGEFNIIGLDPLTTTFAFNSSSGLVFAAAVTPVPGTLAVFAIVGLGGRRRRRAE